MPDQCNANTNCMWGDQEFGATCMDCPSPPCVNPIVNCAAINESRLCFVHSLCEWTAVNFGTSGVCSNRICDNINDASLCAYAGCGSSGSSASFMCFNRQTGLLTGLWSDDTPLCSSLEMPCYPMPSSHLYSPVQDRCAAHTAPRQRARPHLPKSVPIFPAPQRATTPPSLVCFMRVSPSSTDCP